MPRQARNMSCGSLFPSKAFPIEQDEHLLAVLRYVERNPLRANLCQAAEDWRYESAWRRVHGDAECQTLLAAWPVPRPRQWRYFVNKPQTEVEVEEIRYSIRKGNPYGSDRWISQAAARLQLRHTLRPRGRPKLKQ